MKIDILVLIRYLLIAICIAAFSIIFGQPVLMLLLFVFVLIFPVSFFIFKNAFAKYSFRLSHRADYVELPNNAEFEFSYVRESGLPLFNAGLKFTLENRYFKNETTRFLTVPITKKSNSFLIPVNVSEIGLVTVKTESLELRDFTSLFIKTLPFVYESSIPVIPIVKDTIEPPFVTPKEGTDEYTESEAIGNVSSDVKEIREYRPGDRLQRIHWKLSAKLDDLFVKEMAHTSTLSIIILPDLFNEKIGDTVSTLVSASVCLIKQKTRFEICVFNSDICDFTYFTVTNEEELFEAITYLFCQPLSDRKDEAKDTFLASQSSASTIISICGKSIDIGE